MACVLYELLGGYHSYRRQNTEQAKAQQLENQLRKPAPLPHSCWRALRTALTLSENERRITSRERHEAFQANPSTGLTHWLGRLTGWTTQPNYPAGT